MLRLFGTFRIAFHGATRRASARALSAAVLAVAAIWFATPLLAGTTGSLTGTLTDASGAAVGGAKLTVVSPSQSATTLTDSSGRFTFLSLAPDTYALSGELQGYDTVSISGTVIFADV